MFSKNSLLHDVDIINKLICLIITIIGLVLINEPIFVLLINLLLLIMSNRSKILFKTNITNVGISIVFILFPQFLWISKIFILTNYYIMLKEITAAKELRYVLEKTLYRFQTREITYRILYMIYFLKYYKNNFKKILGLKEDYQLKGTYQLYSFLLKKTYQKTTAEMKDLLKYNKLRFYNYYKKRSYVEKHKWQSWDTTYLMIHLIIFVAVIIYGR